METHPVRIFLNHILHVVLIQLKNIKVVRNRIITVKIERIDRIHLLVKFNVVDRTTNMIVTRKQQHRKRKPFVMRKLIHQVVQQRQVKTKVEMNRPTIVVNGMFACENIHQMTIYLLYAKKNL